MKLTTKGRYGIHAMYDLAECGPDSPQSVKAIAERQRIPEAYLEQLIASLKRDGLVVSARGALGGYRIAKPPEEITVGEVLRSLEGDVLQIECLSDEDACERADSCPSRRMFQRLRDGMNAMADSITLRDMINDGAAMKKSASPGEE